MPHPIEHVIKTPELTDEQRASIPATTRPSWRRVTTLASSSSGVVPSDDRRLTVLHRRESGPSSIYFAAASQAACDPVAVRRAEQFGVGGVFLH